MDTNQLKSDLVALAAATKMVREKVKKAMPIDGECDCLLEEMVENLRTVYRLLFIPEYRGGPCLK